jgi:PIF1-like helicase
VTALNKTRIGKADEHTLDLFRACRRPLTHDASIIPTRMYPIRKLVDEENTVQFDRLNTPIHVYAAVDMQSAPDGTPDLRYVLRDLQAPMGLKLRVGAQVMLLANLNVTGGLVNGTRGVVKEFVTMKDAEKEVAAQALERGAPNEEASNEMSAMRTFARGNTNMMFPKVLFETKDTTKEVLPHFPHRVVSRCTGHGVDARVGHCDAAYVVDSVGSSNRSFTDPDPAYDGLGFDDP